MISIWYLVFGPPILHMHCCWPVGRPSLYSLKMNNSSLTKIERKQIPQKGVCLVQRFKFDKKDF